MQEHSTGLTLIDTISICALTGAKQNTHLDKVINLRNEF
jgi:hypothetical protein